MRKGGDMLKRMLRLVVMVAAFVLVAASISAAAVALSGGSPASPASVTDDVKGNCDEAEHVNDPECQGPQEPEVNDDDGVPSPGPTQTPGDDDGIDDDDDDVSG